MADSRIEWTDKVWNPVVGCSVVSPGCTNCYAMKMAHRLEAMGVPAYRGLTTPTKAGAVWNGQVRVVEDALTLPLRWKKPARIFVNSMSDLFHPDVPDAAIDQVFAVMALAPQHTFQILTKRPERMRAYFASRAHGDPWAEAADHIADVLGQDEHPSVPEPKDFPLPNVWLGVSVEDQARADERIPILLDTPAAVRWISAEPLLGPVDVRQWIHDWGCGCGWGGNDTRDCCNNCGWIGDAAEENAACPRCGEPLSDYYACRECDENSSEPHTFGPNTARLDWVVAGGESGLGARPMHPDWVRSLRDQCAVAGVPFLFKQWGEACPLRPELIPVPQRNIGWVSQSGDHIWNARDRDYARMNHHDDVLGGHTPWWSQVVRVGKKAAGRMLDGQLHDAYPEARNG